METANVPKGMVVLTSEQISIDLRNATDEQLEAYINEANQRGTSVNLGIPSTQETIRVFFDEVFKCKRCGRCCRGDFPTAGKTQHRDGIPVMDEEISRIANYLKARPRRIKRLCKSNSQGGLSLSCPCPFYSTAPRAGCSVYPVRPLACQSYPLYSVYPVYSATARDVLKEKLNEKPLLSIDAKCQQAMVAALQILELRRDAAQKSPP